MELDDYEVDRAPYEPEPTRKNRGPLLPAAALLVLLTALAAFVVWRRAGHETPAATQDRAEKIGEGRTPLGASVEPITLPPLDLTDPLVRELLGRLSSRPEVAAWLAGDNLIRNFVASVDNVAMGQTPARQLRRLAPAQPFATETRGNTVVVDARSYARFDGLADTVASLDAGGLARLYSSLKPRLQDAYRELGHPDGDIDLAVERAIGRLLLVPILESSVPLIAESPGLFTYADERLEALSSAERQLLRMGPRNVRLVQDKLRDIARALGVPSSRLPG